MAASGLKRLGILTGGGDCPGLNAVIRAVAKPAMNEYNAAVFGIEDGFEGLVEGRMRQLANADVSGIINLGGTILGTSNKGDPWHYPDESVNGKVEIVDASSRAIKNYKRWGLDALVAIGGDGTMQISKKLTDHGLNVVGVPKTIDNDLSATDVTFGYDSALAVATEAIDRLHTTASSHHRVMVIEVMGRYAGWIALGAGLAGGADIILIPEIPFAWKSVFRKVIDRSVHGKRFSIVCVAEGTKCPDVGEIVKEMDVKRTDAKRLGGVGEFVAEQIALGTELETRVTVLGHLQRGGSPTPYDRILATNFGAKAVALCAAGNFGQMVALRGSEVVSVPIKEAIAKQKLVPHNHAMVLSARAVGTSFGDD
ncbi:ATP-dependent 6-phosphofructokinase [candidate division KSB1 bacterium]|nr:MAG: ATP-dependent 6-phosphofructokinase [candidate division KSB1 bacterium]MBC6946942.1 ATP-dependent 6-phosphofructokinase [candidate division KSB1 bacterium]MCE7942325.1 ATP-dependent 6-phosphofructokinase [Chlorobi bacterium CHB1]MDL1875315.1 ATP-dependent 6-phosphofructokinase [Cytophagia bacterium CHB2]